jgi:hypothetical protein
MVIAQIAYNHLQPAVKARCDALIAVPLTFSNTSSTNFVTAACWADDFKSSLGSSTWHYIDLPLSLDGTPTLGVAVESFDVVQALNLCISTLGSGKATQTNQALYLRYLLHFVGDIQQPLHCSTGVSSAYPAGDAGGNDFLLSGTWTDLHSLWDTGGGYLSDTMTRPLTSAKQTTLSNKVAVVEAKYPYTTNNSAIPIPMNWALESFQLAQTVAYAGISRGSAPTSAYTNLAQATTEQRMALGGHRLADLLNTLFSTNAVSLGCVCSNGMMALSWSAIPGRTYHIQWKRQLADGSWSALADVVAVTNSASYSELAAQTQRFYRVAQ